MFNNDNDTFSKDLDLDIVELLIDSTAEYNIQLDSYTSLDELLNQFVDFISKD